MAHASVDKLIIEIGSNETVLGLLGDLAQDIKKYAGDPAGSNVLSEDLDRARKYPEEPAERAAEAEEAEALAKEKLAAAEKALAEEKPAAAERAAAAKAAAAERAAESKAAAEARAAAEADEGDDDWGGTATKKGKKK